MKIFHLLIFSMFLYHGLLAQRGSNFTLDRDILSANKSLYIHGKDKAIRLAGNKLINDADRIVKLGKKYSVTFNDKVLSNVSNHEYMSISRYSWPNPKTKNGLPYITIDGKTNYTNARISDKEYIDGISRDIFILGMAFYYTNKDKYAAWAKELVDCFFIDEKTRLNPNLDYASVVPGVPNTGGSVIESVVLIDLVEGIQLLKNSAAFKDCLPGVKAWFINYLDWMNNSVKGKVNIKDQNNKGTYNTLQRCVYHLFVGQNENAKRTFEREAFKRVNDQISSDGSMPQELRRAVPLGYVKYNLMAFKMLDNLGKTMGYNLFDYKGPKGQSLMKANEWLSKYGEGQEIWKYSKESGVTNMDNTRNMKKSELTRLKFTPRRFSNYLDLLTEGN